MSARAAGVSRPEREVVVFGVPTSFGRHALGADSRDLSAGRRGHRRAAVGVDRTGAAGAPNEIGHVEARRSAPVGLHFMTAKTVRRRSRSETFDLRRNPRYGFQNLGCGLL